MKQYEYAPKGTCSRLMQVEIDDDGIISKVKIIGGCSGNTQGVSRLVEGMDAKKAIGILKGIRCGFKPTSCPDQLSIALEKCLEEGEN